MNNSEIYSHVRRGGLGLYERTPGLMTVWGKESVQFLDGMVTNDMKTLADSDQMLAAFPNAQGRLLAVVRMRRAGDRFLIDTEAETLQKVFQNLYRFTFAGDFFVEDHSDQYRCFELFSKEPLNAPDGAVSRCSGSELAVRLAHSFSARLAFP